MKSYRQHFDGVPVPPEVYSGWDTTNMQLITGTQTPGLLRIMVIDLDGEEAQAVWKKMVEVKGPTTHQTWIARTGGGGVHIYYIIPGDVESLETGPIWGLWDTFGGKNGKEESGDWVKHKRIDRMADRALIVAPPSIHVESGKAYEWMPGRSPRDFPLPAIMPAWIGSMPVLKPSNLPSKEIVHVQGRGRETILRPSKWCDSATVMEAIPIRDRINLVKSWGLRLITEEPNSDGWIRCRAPGREDNNPSGAFSPATGIYYDSRDDEKLSMFDLGAALGVFADWRECKDWCSVTYVRETQKASAV